MTDTVTLRWRTVDVDGAGMRVLEASQPGTRTADPLLFLHGWGLSPQTYAEGIAKLTAAGIRVIAPCLPGFGGSDGPGLGDVTMQQYAARIGRLLDLLEVEKPVFVVGHSFGGGVAIQLATDRPERVRSLTLVSSVGGAPGRRGSLVRASWIRWALGTVTELSPKAIATSTPGMLRVFIPNLVRKPITMALTAHLALTVDLAAEAGALVASNLPVLFVWGADDRLILPGALGKVASHIPAEVVKGRHGWMMAQPEEFAALLQNALVVHAMLERKVRGQSVVAAKPPTLMELFPPERRAARRVT